MNTRSSAGDGNLRGGVAKLRRPADVSIMQVTDFGIVMTVPDAGGTIDRPARPSRARDAYAPGYQGAALYGVLLLTIPFIGVIRKYIQGAREKTMDTVWKPRFEAYCKRVPPELVAQYDRVAGR
jgi:hypothetical protein